MRRRSAGWLLGFGSTVAGTALLACPPAVADGAVLSSGPVSLAWRAEPARLAVGQPFVVLATVCPAAATLVAVDATMPDHRHGMNYRTSLQPLGEGRWRVEGLLWHMGGRWELRFDLRHDEAAYSLRQDVLLR